MVKFERRVNLGTSVEDPKIIPCELSELVIRSAMRLEGSVKR
jgi:hypothetical protein